MLNKIIGIMALFGIGYLVPDVLGLEKKMEFADEVHNLKLVDCVIDLRHCAAGDYSLELVDGAFSTLERTTFVLLRNGEPIKSEVLVTSDDKQFGTLKSQRHSLKLEQSQVLIPYCGNPIMNIVLIDAATRSGVTVRL
jgi:hypothetical protein